MRICSKCKRGEDETSFYQSEKAKWCKECQREAQRKYRKTPKGKASQDRLAEYCKKRYRESEVYKNNQRIKKEKEDKKRTKKKEREEAERIRIDIRNKRINDPIIKCKKCGEMKPNNEFWKYKSGVPRQDCKVCQLKSFVNMDSHSQGKKPKEVIRCWKLLNAAVASGDVVKQEECTKCGSVIRVQAHHEDYSKPFDVVWLCEMCHKETHKNKRKEQQ